MYSYQGLENILKEKNMSKTELSSILGISSRTIAKMNKNEKVSDRVLKKIAIYLQCDITDLYKIISDNPILQVLREEKEAGISGGLYHELQVRLTYNSNHIEGSKLTEDQTRLIFDTRTIDTRGGVPVDDIIETSNHFRAVDYCIDHADEQLNEEFIKHLHYILKSGTKDESLNWFAVGEYKKRPNMVGGKPTVRPTEVSNYMKKLISDYLLKENHTIEDIIEFHSNFEHIHPFQDGNGRVGRLIAFKECLHYNIVPFIIEDSKKMYYYRGLSNWNDERGWLIDTCLDGQDIFYKILNLFDIKID